MSTTDNEYWAAKATPQMLPEAFKKIDAWFQHVRTDGLLEMWRNALREYYAGEVSGGKMGTAGASDEFTTIKVNHVHNLGEHVVTAIAGQPPAFQPQAMNSDHESTAQTVIAQGILEAAVTRKGLDNHFPTVTRKAVVLSEGWGSLEWDTTMGDDYAADPATGQIVKTGDVRYRQFDPVDVIRDWNRESGEEHAWTISRRWENRWDVLARAQKAVTDKAQWDSWRSLILGLPSKVEEMTERPRLVDVGPQDQSDDVAVWELRHAKTDALPGGRRCVFVDPKVWLEDGPLKYPDTMMYRMSPEEQIGSERGYTQTFDLLPLQKAINASYSTVLSNHNTLGHTLIWVRPNSNLSTEQLQAFTIIKSEEKPEALTLTKTPAEIPAFAKDLIGQAEILSGVNAVRRGNLDATGKLSGAAYALIDAKFIEAVVGLQRAFKTYAQRIATGTIDLYKAFATVEHTLQMVGKSNRSYVETFTGERLKKVSRVDVEMGNPMSRTSSGRLELAKMLMSLVDPRTGKPNGIHTPEQFMQVITTGRLEPLTEGPAKELDNVKAENEALGDAEMGPPAVDEMGQPVETLSNQDEMPVALAIDNHPLHIEEHSAVLSSPEARRNKALVQAVLAHIQEHMDAWVNTDPRTLAARGIPPPPAPPPPPMPPGMAPPGAPGPTNGTPPPVPGATNVAGPEGAAPQPGMPQMPQNPESGEQAPSPPMM